MKVLDYSVSIHRQSYISPCISLGAYQTPWMTHHKHLYDVQVMYKLLLGTFFKSAPKQTTAHS